MDLQELFTPNTPESPYNAPVVPNSSHPIKTATSSSIITCSPKPYSYQTQLQDHKSEHSKNPPALNSTPNPKKQLDPLDSNILALKFHYRSLFHKTINSIKLSQKYETKRWAFKRLTIAIITQIQTQKQHRLTILLHKRRRIFLSWKIFIQNKVKYKKSIQKARNHYTSKLLQKSTRALFCHKQISKFLNYRNKKLTEKIFFGLVLNCEGLKHKREQSKCTSETFRK